MKKLEGGCDLVRRQNHAFGLGVLQSVTKVIINEMGLDFYESIVVDYLTYCLQK